jgi:hypothetical protein
MTVVDEYSSTARKAQDAWVNASESWVESTQKAFEQFSSPFLSGSYVSTFPVSAEDAVAVVDQWFDFAERVLDANREYAKNLAGVANAFGGAVREHVDSLGGAVRDQVQAVADTAKDQADKVEQGEEERVSRTRRA